MVPPPLTTFLDTFLWAPVSRLLDVQAQTFWVTYLSALVIAAGVYLVSRRRRTSLRGLTKYLWPRRIWAHPGVWLDAKMYLFSSFFLFLQGAIVFAALGDITAHFRHGIEMVAGPSAPDHALPLWANIGVPVLLYLALELGYWFSHWLLHRVPWLWEFHKVHHSAEVLTPLTEWRQHPVEFILLPLTISATVGLTLAPLQWIWGANITFASLWSPGLIFLIFSMTTVHLRHSHVKLNAPGWLGYIIHSPRHHHIHHSTDPAHFDRNLGFCLSVWDWAFGTLTLPSRTDRIQFGLRDETGARDALAASHSLRTHLWLPVIRMWDRLRTPMPNPATPVPAAGAPNI